MRYYASAEEMAASLDLPLLLRTDVDLRFLERHDRLSGYAAERPHAGRLYHRVIAALGTTGLADRVLWVAGPWGSLEHLPWAIGLAAAMADAGLRAYLHAGWIDLPHSGTGAAGEHFGGALGARAESLGGGPLASFPTDLQGVRVLVAGDGAHSATISASGLVLADTLPEELEAPCRLPDGIDGVVLVAAFRDHGVYELESCVRQLRSAGHRILGLVGMGPEAGKVLESPESRLGSARESTGQALIGLNSPIAPRDLDPRPAAAIPPPERPVESPPPKVDPPKERVAPTEDSSLSRARAMETDRSADPKRHSTGKAKREAPPKSETSPSFAAVRPKAPSGPAPIGPAPIAPEREPREADEPKVAPLLQPNSPKSEEPPSYTRLPIAPAVSSEMAAMPEPKREPVPTPAPAPKPERAPAQAASPVPAPSSAPAMPTPAKPSSGGGPAVPLLSRWEAEAKRDRRMNVIGATVGVLVLVLLAAGMGLVYGKRKGWIPSRQPTTASATQPATAPPPFTLGMPTAPPSDTIEDAPALGTTPAEPPTERRAAGLEEESEPGRDANGGTPDPKPTRDFPWGTPKSAFASSDSVRADSAAAKLVAPAGVALPDSAAGPDAGDFVVHLSSFKLEREAAAEVANLAALGVDARYLLVDVPGKGPWYRVVTGRFATFAEAEARAMRLCRSKGVPRTHVAGLGGRGAPVPVDSLAGVPAESRPRMD